MAALLGNSLVAQLRHNLLESNIITRGAFENGAGLMDNGAGVIRVLLVDDVESVRQSLRSILATYPNFEVVGEACDGEEAVLAVHQLRPSVIVMDINMPRLNGIKATARIKRTFPHVIIVGLSVYATEDTRQLMTAAGATTVISKEAAVEQLRDEILESVNRRSTAFH